MKKQRFTESQIFAILKEGESGVMIVPDLCRKHGVGPEHLLQRESQIWRYGSR